jgi:flagellar hook assembly protein FlgD
MIKNNELAYDSIGIYIHSGTPHTKQNNINGYDYGAYNHMPSSIRILTENFWGDSLGPYHPICNPSGSGDKVSDGIGFDPWLISNFTYPFMIFNISISKTTFDPANDTTEITAKTTAMANWTLDVIDTLGQSVRHFSGTDTLIDVLWDGTDEYGGTVANGLYYYRIGAASQTNDTAASALGRVWIGNPIAEITSPQKWAISTGGDTISVWGTAWCLDFDKYQLFHAPSSQPSSWSNIKTSTISVKDSILADWNTAGLYRGFYNLKLEVTDDNSNVIADTTDSIGIEVIYQNTYIPNPFSPNGDEHKDTTIIKGKISLFSDYSITIIDISNDTIKRWTGNNDTVFSIVWDGTDIIGDTVPEGDYNCRIEAVDVDSGITATPKISTIVIDNTYPICYITCPADSDTIRSDTIAIIGTATDDNFQYYRVYYKRIDPNPTNWISMKYSTNQATDDTLALWNLFPLDNGEYQLRLEVNDSANIVQDTVFALCIDNLKIDSIMYSATAFVPQDDDSLAIIFRINHDANIVAKIYQGYDDTVNLVKTIDLGDVSAGIDTFYWDGTDESRGYVTFGDYRLEITGQGIYGSTGYYNSQASSTYNPDWGLDPSLIDCIVTIINISRGERTGNLSSHMVITGPIKVSGKIYSGNYLGGTSCFSINASVKTMNPPAQGMDFFYSWNGRDNSGSYVSSGYYVALWSIVKKYPHKTIIVGVYKPLIDSVKAEPRLILGNDEVVEVKFIPRWDCDVSVKVHKVGLIKTLYEGSLTGGSEHKFEWNGKDSNDQYVTNTGEYTIIITATSHGMFATEKTPVNVYR